MTLEQRLRFYADSSAAFVRKGGEVPATFFLEDAEGKVYPLTFAWGTTEEKDDATRIVRKVAGLVHAVRIIYVAEAWVTSHSSKAELEVAPLPSEDPRREEVLTFSAEDLHEQITGWMTITRKKGRTKVGPFERMDHSVSRFLDLLPGRRVQ